MVTVISLGGSIVAPEGVDQAFLKDFVSLIRELLEKEADRRFIFVVGGGGPARIWQRAYREISGGGTDGEADWIGVMATRLNAQLIRALMGQWCSQDVVTDPTKAEAMTGKVLVAAGWKPGFSSDYDAVLLAERFHADSVLNLSNIEQVYTDDPKKNPQAKPINTISWPDFRALVGEEWVPGKNVPFDPIASREAAKIGLKVICAAGRDLENLKKILRGEAFLGTTIG
ncbi:putative uridylate kinase [Treponema primitia ZAS-2]|uniref:Uridylate kinase n=1 Tax=Treponema primitia (strain ATCC BAA-887 / DSM 12427 / ZAS-2) TaxID=545694 RepID=F5YNS1_TREPZ|nr:UMP kinase [Treponema primitia]AEF86672.1 putative uridylate kinase [Treponema primitia ZAS-2]